ncbi:3'(2'),5'-bisphosphate nucleotidase CysQ [Rheinheimera baltica]|uniref:3'(2'),5'-bisphosphate nucleotidase CysQ n=1 Tax=Rheinheimera baltica TaxID=67576 RepID=A0ABT9I5M3_9GAMM|nr:3'(2'),5'-bisphosphate nucleotidase CysQ [Rheinheimera baltica]MDP5138696.1 3'(2'),5'-bisphosphate nucleotidase CysQ [Rheinheimera baltica]MDP5151009.1 3'(2'),5'-bisphosphate nucleotidase CysQ [Rheinheimera baltica]
MHYLNAVIDIAEQAGKAILAVYQQDTAAFNITGKADDSPLTAADLAAHQLIVKALTALTPHLPILSEEAADISWEIRKTWQRYWLVDPLDGTKEFIKRNGEFTVNIALIDDGEPVLGVIHAPVLNKTYYAAKGEGAFVKTSAGVKAAKVSTPGDVIRVVGSRSHPSPDLAGYLAQFAQHDMVPVGSSLKFCLVAEGLADVYPRFGPTMQWDTGAGHIIALEAGASVSFDGITSKVYQREQLLNPHFMVSALTP